MVGFGTIGALKERIERAKAQKAELHPEQQ
jgi:hypothetical protein